MVGRVLAKDEVGVRFSLSAQKSEKKQASSACFFLQGALYERAFTHKHDVRPLKSF